MANNLSSALPHYQITSDPMEIDFSKLMSFKKIKGELIGNMLGICMVYGITCLCRRKLQNPTSFIARALISTSITVSIKTVYRLGCQFLGNQPSTEQFKNTQNPKLSQKMRAISWKVIHVGMWPLHLIDQMYSKIFNIATYCEIIPYRQVFDHTTYKELVKAKQSFGDPKSQATLLEIEHIFDKVIDEVKKEIDRSKNPDFFDKITSFRSYKKFNSFEELIDPEMFKKFKKYVDFQIKQQVQDKKNKVISLLPKSAIFREAVVEHIKNMFDLTFLLKKSLTILDLRRPLKGILAEEVSKKQEMLSLDVFKLSLINIYPARIEQINSKILNKLNNKSYYINPLSNKSIHYIMHLLFFCHDLTEKGFF